MTRFLLPLLCGLSALTLSASACSAGGGATEPGGDGDGDTGDGDGDIALGDGDGDAGDGDISLGDGDGNGDGDTGMGGADMSDCDATLELVIRDFNVEHPDMQDDNGGWADIGCGMVQSDLFIGAEGTRTPLFQAGNGTGKRNIVDGVINCTPWDPVTNPEPDFQEITDEASFNQWYTDDAAVNSTFEHTLTLAPLPGNDSVYYFDSADSGAGFFPADGKGFNEITSGHNYHFTTEAHVRFIYKAGDKFSFSGDDDMWIFVNGKLALDLGGLHGPLSASIDFDAQAAALGITPDNSYNMDIFHAERHTSDSNYRVETSIGCFETVDVPRVVVK